MTISLESSKEADFPAIVALMNVAFRRTHGDRSWSTEAQYITGTRISESLLREEIEGGAQFLFSFGGKGTGGAHQPLLNPASRRL